MPDAHAQRRPSAPTALARPQARRDPCRGQCRVQRRSAFTLIEVLIVVGILTLLVSVAVIGFRVVGTAMKTRATDVALKNCQGMLTEFTKTVQAEQLLSDSVVAGMTSSTGNYKYRWAPPAGLNRDLSAVGCRLGAPNYQYNGKDDNSGTDFSATPITDPVQQKIRARVLQDDTARVLKRLAQVPGNRASLETMTADRVVRVRFPANPADASASLVISFKSVDERPECDYPSGTGVIGLVDGVNLLDGFGHPIYFVPGGGLMYVNVGYSGKGSKSDPASYAQQLITIQAPDHRPFWASPGPDGDLSTGDDNVYSFEQ